MNRDPAPAELLASQLRDIELVIAKKRLLTEMAREIASAYSRRSNLGWLVSIFTIEAGTLLAVLSGATARGWDSVARELEHELVLLEVDRRIKQRELAAAT